MTVKELSIYSPANVAVKYRLAGLGERSLAFFLDAVGMILATSFVAYLLGSIVVPISGNDNFMALFVYVFFPLISFLLYFALAEYLNDGQTIGKQIIGLRTIRIDGAPPTFETYGLRSTMLFIDCIMGLGSIGLITAASNPNRQRIGDRIAQTVVIQNASKSLYRLQDILNIKTVDDHEVIYAKAKELTTDQALLIKEIIVRWEDQRNDELAKTLRATVIKLSTWLELKNPPAQNIEFLRQILRDYIVLTR